MSPAVVRAARAWGPYALVAAVAALPFALGPFAGHPLYFRDLSLYFFPLRRLVLSGLREGALRFWNPYVHEGEPLALPPIAYPLDLLQALRPDEVGISFVLTLHVPLAAVWMMALARKGLGLSATGAAAAAVVYALGGFALSTVNLYLYAQALAWAPAAALGLVCAARGDRRAVALGAVATGILLSTTAAEMIAQALAIGVVLALPCAPAALARMAGVLALGAALAAPTALVIAQVAASSARATGFPVEVVLAHSIHPLTLAQVVIAGFYGDTARLTERWWGENFFPRGFPYFLSLYLGLAALAAAGVGLARGRGPRLRLAVAAALALVLALGQWGLASGIAESFDLARRFRYPSKLFFTVHFAAALLAGMGIDAVARGTRNAWRGFALAALALGAFLCSAPLWPALAEGRARWFAAGFFPAHLPGPARLALLDWVLSDAATGGAFVVAAGTLAFLAWRGRLAPGAAAAGVVALIAADLLRAGAGLNPATGADFFATSPEIARHHEAWRAGRVFTCDPASSAAYARARSARADHERLTFAMLRDTAAPLFNVASRLPSALSPDLTMLVSPDRLLDPRDGGCADLDRILAPMRSAGVAHVIALDPLAHPDLVLQAEERPPGLAPLAVYAYALRDPLPMASVTDPASGAVAGTAELARQEAGRIEVRTTAAAPAILTVREAGARGWEASIDGAAASIGRAERGHMALAVPAGAHVVSLEYSAPGFRAGVSIALVGALVILGLLLAPRRKSPG